MPTLLPCKKFRMKHCLQTSPVRLDMHIHAHSGIHIPSVDPMTPFPRRKFVSYMTLQLSLFSQPVYFLKVDMIPQERSILPYSRIIREVTPAVFSRAGGFRIS